MKQDIEYAGSDDPTFPRATVHETRDFAYYGSPTPTMKFIFKKWSELKEEFPYLDPAKVAVDSYGHEDSYSGAEVTFRFTRPQNDQEYAKSLYYHRQSLERKAKRAAEKALTAEQKISAKEAKERADYERLKKKYGEA